MLAFTVWQPWASLIMVGAKPYEFRPKSYLDARAYHPLRPKPGDPVVVHAGARRIKPAEIEDLLRRLGTEEDTTGLVAEIARPLLERLRQAYKYQGLPLGCGLGSAIIGTPKNAGTIFRGKVNPGVVPQDSDRGEFNWAWPLRSPHPFAAPLPMRGAQGFWQWPGYAEAA